MLKKSRNSIGRKLFTSISLLILISLTLIYFLGFFNTKKEIQEILDANMAKSGKLILALIYHEIEEGEADGFLDDFEEEINERILHKYESQIHIQVWRSEDLVYSSDRKFLIEKPQKEGFKDVDIADENWRIFTLFDDNEKITIAILEQYKIRSNLIWKILASPFIPLGISSLLILLIWIFIDQKIGALNILSKKIANTSANKLIPFNDLNPPLEIKPLVDSLNSLILRLASSIEAERRFTDYAAHELRTPLAVIKTHIQLLIKDNKKAQDQEFLHDLEMAMERMIHLVNQVLILSRLEPESENFAKEKFLLSEIISAQIALLESEIKDKKIKIISSCKGEKPYFGNKTYIEIMLRNLLDNALKYSVFGAEIKVDLSCNDKEISLKISNFGDFISKENQVKIFDVFYRVDTKNKGCGLGLAIAKKIAVLHHARIEFTSREIEKDKALNEVLVKFLA